MHVRATTFLSRFPQRVSLALSHTLLASYTPLIRDVSFILHYLPRYHFHCPLPLTPHPPPLPSRCSFTYLCGETKAMLR